MEVSPYFMVVGPVPRASANTAFTLVELLTVMAVIVLIVSLAGPAVNALKGAGDVDKAVYDIAGVIQVAAAYAKSNNTYVYLGLEEVGESQSSGATPQVVGIGRVAIALVAAKDGTRGYQLSDLSNGINLATFQADLASVGNVQVFDNLHLADLLGTSTGGAPVLPTTGNMVRPALTSDATSGFGYYNLADSNCVSVTSFAYPLGTTASTGRYYFQKVIQFDSQGVARIQTATDADTITSRMEIGLQQTHGASAPALTPPVARGNVAAIQIDGVTGAARIYRP
jgi:prepilin-type N-terminal cleavage/methylation domain-containing protein